MIILLIKKYNKMDLQILETTLNQTHFKTHEQLTQQNKKVQSVPRIQGPCKISAGS